MIPGKLKSLDGSPRPILFAVAICALAGILIGSLKSATLYRDPSKDMPGTDYGLYPTNTPMIGDVLTMGPAGTSWTRLTNFFREWSGTSGGLAIPIAATNYFPPNNSSTNLVSVEAAGATRIPLTRATVIQNLYVIWSPAPGSGKTNFVTLWTNGVASPLTVQIVGTATNGSDTVDAVTLAAGDQIGIRIATQSAAVAGKACWAFEGR